MLEPVPAATCFNLPFLFAVSRDVPRVFLPSDGVSFNRFVLRSGSGGLGDMSHATDPTELSDESGLNSFPLVSWAVRVCAPMPFNRRGILPRQPLPTI